MNKDNNYNCIKVKLIKGKNGEGIKFLPLIKKNFGSEYYKDIIKTLRYNTNYADYFEKELFPASNDNIITQDTIPLMFDEDNISEDYVSHEIECFISFLEVFSKKINTFISDRLNFETMILHNESEKALEILKKIEQECGVSFWLLESYFLHSNYSMSYAMSEQFYQEQKNECIDFYIKTFLRTLRRKTNLQENIYDIRDFIERKSKSFEKNNNISTSKQMYYSFCNNEIDKLQLYGFYHLLNMATNLNLIDMFLLIDRLAIYFVGSSEFSDVSKERIIKKVQTSDLELTAKKSCELLNGIFNNDSLTENVYKAKKLLFYEKFKELNELCLDVLQNNNPSFEIISLYTKAEILNTTLHKEKNNLLNFLVKNMISATLKTGDYKVFNSTFDSCSKLLYLLDSTSLFFGYSNFYQNAFNADNSKSILDILSSNWYNRNIFCFYKENNAKSQLNYFYGNYESSWYHITNLDESLSYDGLSVELNEIEKDFVSFENAHKNTSVYLSKTEIARNRYNEKRFNHYVQTNNIDKAISLYVDLQFEAKLKVTSFNVNIINSKLHSPILKTLYRHLDFCIYAELTNCKGAKGLLFNNEAANSLLYILKSNNVNFPSQLPIPNNPTNIEKAKYAYLFRHICKTELLLEKLVSYSINDDNPINRLKEVLYERKKLLNKAIELDLKEEVEQIKIQLKHIEDEIAFAEQYELGKFMITSARILEDSVRVSDTDIVFPFFEKLNTNLLLDKNIDFNDTESGGFLMFRDWFVKYKKAYIKELDNQIGVNIRHGFFKNEILNFFVNLNIALKSCPSDNNIKQFTEEFLTKIAVTNGENYWRKYINLYIDFSQKLYKFIDNTLNSMRLENCSVQTDDIYKVYIDDETISNIAITISKCKTPYEFRDVLNSELVKLLDPKLLLIGEDIKCLIDSKCKNLLNECFNIDTIENPSLVSNIKAAKNDLYLLSDEIKKWFGYIKESDRNCSINQYFIGLKSLNPNLEYNINNDIPDLVKMNLLHCLDIILSNLIMNAKAHSNIEENALSIKISLKMNNDSIELYFHNNINNINESNMIKIMERIKYNFDNYEKIEQDKSGRGFIYIAEIINKTFNTRGQLEFYKNKLPNYFALKIKIQGSDIFV